MIPKKCQAEDNRNHKTDNQSSLFSDLRAVNSKCHRETAEDQYGRVDGAEFPREVIASGGESKTILRTIERVDEEHSAEEHDLRNKKDPHSQRTRFTLLLEILKVMLQRRVMYFVLYRYRF